MSLRTALYLPGTTTGTFQQIIDAAFTGTGAVDYGHTVDIVGWGSGEDGDPGVPGSFGGSGGGGGAWEKKTGAAIDAGHTYTLKIDAHHGRTESSLHDDTAGVDIWVAKSGGSLAPNTGGQAADCVGDGTARGGGDGGLNFVSRGGGGGGGAGTSADGMAGSNASPFSAGAGGAGGSIGGGNGGTGSQSSTVAESGHEHGGGGGGASFSSSPGTGDNGYAEITYQLDVSPAPSIHTGRITRTVFGRSRLNPR